MYSLQAQVNVQYSGERNILTKNIELMVVEKWSDAMQPHLHEPSEAQTRERVAAGLGGLLSSSSGEGAAGGSVWVEGIIPDRFFFRGWENAPIPASGGRPMLERERARGEIGVKLSVKNGSNKTLSGVRLSLHRRLKVAGASQSASSGASGPRITEDTEHVDLNGKEWEFAPSSSSQQGEAAITCWIDVPKPERFLSIRKTRLFEVQTLVKVTLYTGALKWVYQTVFLIS